MKKISIFFVCALIALFAYAEYADAARFGSSRSFGSSPSYSSPSTGSSSSSGSFFNSNTSNSTINNSASTAGTRTMGSSGFGIMGGLLAGTLIGSMLMGTPFTGGGLFDILIIAGVVYLLYRLFSSRSRVNTQTQNRQQGTQYSQQNQPDNSQYGQDSYTHQNIPYGQQNPRKAQKNKPNRNQSQPQSNTGDAWDRFRSQPENTQQNRNMNNNSRNAATNTVQNVDMQDFIEGAKTLYIRMQSSWDKRDLNDIAQFTTPKVFEEIQRQAQQDPNPSQTIILSLNAEVRGSQKQDNKEYISVYFTSLLREDQQNAMANNVTEIWHFMRENAQGHWLLDGLEQVH